jgi:hypothetical protein
MDRLVALFFGQRGEREGIGEAGFESTEAAERIVEPGALAQELLRGGRIGPEVRVFGSCVQLGEPLGRGIDVKDASSAVPATARFPWRGLRLRRAWLDVPGLTEC